MDLQAIYIKLLKSIKDLNDKNQSETNNMLPEDLSIFLKVQDFSNELNNMALDDSFVKILDENGDNTLDEIEINAFLNMLESMEQKGINISGDEEISTDEINTSTDETQNTEENNEIKMALNKIYENDSAQKMLDLDNDGEISEEEKKVFENFIKGNKKELTVDDIEKVYEDIQNGVFKYPSEEEIPDDEKVDFNKTDDTQEANSVDNTQSRAAKTSGGGYDQANYSGGGVDGNSTVNNNEKTLDNMSLDELKAEKSTRENNVSEARNAVNDVYNGNNAQVAAKEKEYELSEEAYKTALENDENISDELKEQESKTLEEIDTTKGEINDLNIEINNKNNEISDTEGLINADKSNISALESALSSLNSFSSDDEEKLAEVSAKKAEVTQKLSDAKEQKERHEEQLETLKEELDKLNSDLEEKESQLDDLEQERQSIENEILENCSDETKTALENFNKAETELEDTKTEELSKAQTTLTEAENSLQEINEAINVKEAKQTERTYSVNDLENYEKLYETMGLKEQGLNFDVFSLAMEGYLNLEDKGNGYLGIFDTTQSDDKERYYLLDLNNFEVVARSVLKIGSGDMSNITNANKGGSHATLSGFEKIGGQYYSNSMGKYALQIIGLEQGINDNALSKGTVVHYTTNNHTW